MAKRIRSRSAAKGPLRAVELPGEVWTEIVGHIPLQDTATVFSFLLCCKAARTYLEPLLKRWTETLRAARLLPKTLENYAKNPALDQLDLLVRGYKLHAINRLDAGQHEPVFCLTLYYMYHLVKLQRAWKLHRATDGLTHRDLHLADIQLRDAFYYDAKQQRFVSFRRYPGLRTVELESSKNALTQQIRDFIAQDVAITEEVDNECHAIKVELMLSGLVQVKEIKRMRVIGYQLMKHKLVSHKPHRNALLCNAVIDGHHLFDAHHHSLLRGKILIFKYRNLTQKQKVVAMMMERGRPQLLQELVRRLTPPCDQPPLLQTPKCQLPSQSDGTPAKRYEAVGEWLFGLAGPEHAPNSLINLVADDDSDVEVLAPRHTVDSFSDSDDETL